MEGKDWDITLNLGNPVRILTGNMTSKPCLKSSKNTAKYPNSGNKDLRNELLYIAYLEAIIGYLKVKATYNGLEILSSQIFAKSSKQE